MQTEIAAPSGQSVGGAEEALDDVGDHDAGRAADEERSEEIAEGQHEGDVAPASKPGRERGKMTRRKVARELAPRSWEASTRFRGDVFKRGIEREKNEGRVNVREHQDDQRTGCKEKKLTGFFVTWMYCRKPFKTPSEPR